MGDEETVHLAAPPTAPAGRKPTSLALIFFKFLVTVRAVVSKIFGEAMNKV
jgi:hypothetical protein